MEKYRPSSCGMPACLTTHPRKYGAQGERIGCWQLSDSATAVEITWNQFTARRAAEKRGERRGRRAAERRGACRGDNNEEERDAPSELGWKEGRWSEICSGGDDGAGGESREIFWGGGHWTLKR
jgi:hypothetical protein